MLNREERGRIIAGLKNIDCRAYQKQFIQDKSRRRIVLKSRQIGFSFICALEALVEALEKGRSQLFASASDRQSRIMIKYVRMFLTKYFDIAPLRASDETVVLANGAELIALPKNYYTVQGFNGSLYFDEFAWNRDAKKIWQVLVPSTSEVRGRITVLSTPYAKRGKFYDLWTDEDTKYSKYEIDIYKAIELGKPIGGCGTVEEYIQELKDDLKDPEFFPSAYECKFIDDKDSYIPLSLIEKVQKLDPDELYNQEIWLGIDIGRLHDATEITAVGENENGIKEVKFIISLYKETFAVQRKTISDLFKKYNVVKCYIDRSGLGINIYEDLQAKFRNRVIGIHFTQKNKEQMAKNLKRHIEEKSILLLKDREAALHYSAIKRIATQSGFKYDCERSKEVKHADKFWSLALALRPFSKFKKKMKTRRYSR
ncbi:MAG: hypothetical protein CR982_03490 [Candidatus Cloacimonadota bacterium]|nr:MAG: hypothetical protein CR982_03490 [Candidatus Cloacimonadota bacterium]